MDGVGRGSKRVRDRHLEVATIEKLGSLDPDESATALLLYCSTTPLLY